MIWFHVFSIYKAILYMKLHSTATIQIQRSAEDIYEAIIDPLQMRHYFLSEGSGRLNVGSAVWWKFPEFPEAFEVIGKAMDPGRLISFVWDAGTLVTITLQEVEPGNTIVKIVEGDKDLTEENILWALRNTEGWANFLACLKAYMEYDINLRKGAFEFMRTFTS